MNFHELLAKMKQIDQPSVEQTTTEMGCGMDAMPPTMPPKADEPPPSMSINLNAQGLENIEELMKLIKAVNPDADKDAMPMAAPMSMPPLKMLPDLDSKEPHMEPDGDEGPEITGLDRDGDGDHDMDDHDAEKKGKEDEAYGNSLGASEPEIKDIDNVTHDGDDLHKKKDMFRAAAGGDNPMAAESTDLRSQIRAELLRRLQEAKGVK